MLDRVEPPPLSEWSSMLGEALHQLRVAFDTLAWDLAHLNGRVPADTGVVQFPLCTKERTWKQLVLNGWLSALEPELIARLRALQPFVAGKYFLPGLHAMNITDKHRGLLTGSVQLGTLTLDGLNFDLGSSTEPVPSLDPYQPVVALESGVVLASLTTAKPPVAVMAHDPILIELDLMVRWEDETLGLREISEKFPTLARQLLRGIQYGHIAR